MTNEGTTLRRLLAIGLAICGLAACQSSGSYREVPAVAADQLHHYKTMTATIARPDGNTIVLICPRKGRVEIPVSGRTKLFRILSDGGALEGFIDAEWNEFAVVRRLVPRSVPANAEPASEILVVLISGKVLLKEVHSSQNIDVYPGDSIVIPSDGQDIRETLRRKFGLTLQPSG